MRIAFASEENLGLRSQLSSHFGRCPFYVFVEIENDEIKKIDVKENPFFNRHVPGAVPQFISEEGANVMVAGGMGPRALDWFNQLNVQPITGANGIIRDVLKDYLAGNLRGVEPCDAHKDSA